MARSCDRTPLTDDERDARRKADRDRLEQAVRALLTSDGWQRGPTSGAAEAPFA